MSVINVKAGIVVRIRGLSSAHPTFECIIHEEALTFGLTDYK
jgi:hypothetical protein